MNGNSPIKTPEAPVSPTPTGETGSILETSRENRGTVSRIPVDAVR